jgi:hypothetical protein
MKKILLLAVAGVLLLSGFGAVAVTKDSSYVVKNVEKSIVISKPVVKDVGRYVKVDLEESTSFLLRAGEPVLPVVTHVFTFPFGSKNISVDVVFSGFKKIALSKAVQPGPGPLPLTSRKDKELFKMNEEPTEDRVASRSGELYPPVNYSYAFRVGLVNEELVILLAVRCYPVRYSPGENMLYFSRNVVINVTYEEPVNSFVSPKEYDLVVIAPKKFSKELRPLVRHKNNHGVSTFLKTTEEIYRRYGGRDKPERIKYFIKDAVEEWGVKYVLLVGGMKHQRRCWYVPVRYSNLDDFSDWESSYISDLYYADIYRYNESSGSYEFEDWDSNGNDVFAEWNRDSTRKDTLDLSPDVYVGRLACRDLSEVKTVVKKTIKYERHTYGRKWFNRMILVAGDTFPNPGDEFEGEMETSRSASYLEPLGFDVVKLFASEETLRRAGDVIKAMSRGAGFVHFAGHGNPAVWATHPPHNDTWINALNIMDMKKLKNRYRLPICVVGGCHNSQFNVTVNNLLLGVLKEGLRYFSIDEDDIGSFWKYEWVPECWSWQLIGRDKTGCIATIGNTGLGYGYPGNYTLEGLGGWIEPRFFHAYAVQSKDILGEAHSQAITDYVNTFDVDRDRIDRKTVEQWVLLGDPSLKIGGYP